MTLTSAEAGQLAADLYRARQTGVAIPPLTAQYPDLTMAAPPRLQGLIRLCSAQPGGRTMHYRLGAGPAQPSKVALEWVGCRSLPVLCNNRQLLNHKSSK